ncbi:MAG: hypothetical protein QXD89_01375 [Candidatus Aenigmatarchaeota archaeon]
MKEKILPILFFLFFPQVKAQLLLPPGNATFLLSSIILNNVSDYTQTYQYIGIFGNRERLDIFWDARYEPFRPDSVNVTCWLNCIDFYNISNCYGFQNCSYEGVQGPGSCTIFNPYYNYSSINYAVCKFSNPSVPEFEFKLVDSSYPRRSFYPIRYMVSSIGGTYTLGIGFNLPVSFLSYSLFEGAYIGFVYVPSESKNYLYVDNSYNTTKKLKYLEIGTVYPKLTFILQKEQIIFYLNTTALELPNYSSLKECPDAATITGKNDAEVSVIDDKCFYSFKITSGSTYYSMPEYDFKTALLILLFSILLFCLVLIFK